MGRSRWSVIIQLPLKQRGFKPLLHGPTVALLRYLSITITQPQLFKLYCPYRCNIFSVFLSSQHVQSQERVPSQGGEEENTLCLYATLVTHVSDGHDGPMNHVAMPWQHNDL